MRETSERTCKEFIKPQIRIVEFIPQSIIAESQTEPSQFEDIHTGSDGKPIDITDKWILEQI